MPAPAPAGVDVKRAQLAVAEPVRQEVQVVEHDQRAELEPRIEGAAHGDAEDRVGARLSQREHVRAVIDV